MSPTRALALFVAPALAGAAVGAACVGKDPSVAVEDPNTRHGERGAPCNEGRCLEGLACVDEVCVDDGHDGSRDVGDTSMDAAVTPDAADGDARAAFTTIFVTSTPFPAALGGLTGADQKCTELAHAAGLLGDYVAILSAKNLSARDRFRPTGAIALTDGTVVANDVTELWSGVIRARIHLDQNRNSVGGTSVWSGTDFDGATDRTTSLQCDGWTSDAGASVELGRTDYTDFRWISVSGDAGQSGTSCTATMRFYCVGPK